MAGPHHRLLPATPPGVFCLHGGATRPRHGNVGVVERLAWDPAFSSGSFLAVEGLWACRLNRWRLTLVLPSPQYSKHLFVHIGQTNPAFSDPPLEAVDVRQIYDKFPEKKGGLKELYEKGPPNAFFLVKFWVRPLLTQDGQLAQFPPLLLLHDQRAPGRDLQVSG